MYALCHVACIYLAPYSLHSELTVNILKWLLGDTYITSDGETALPRIMYDAGSKTMPWELLLGEPLINSANLQFKRKEGSSLIDYLHIICVRDKLPHDLFNIIHTDGLCLSIEWYQTTLPSPTLTDCTHYVLTKG